MSWYRELVDLLVEHPWASGFAFLGLLAIFEELSAFVIQAIQAARGDK